MDFIQELDKWLGGAESSVEQEPTQTPTDWTATDEEIFQDWFAGWAKETGVGNDTDAPDYDYREAYKQGVAPKIGEDGAYHWPPEFARATVSQEPVAATPEEIIPTETIAETTPQIKEDAGTVELSWLLGKEGEVPFSIARTASQFGRMAARSVPHMVKAWNDLLYLSAGPEAKTVKEQIEERGLYGVQAPGPMDDPRIRAEILEKQPEIREDIAALYKWFPEILPGKPSLLETVITAPASFAIPMVASALSGGAGFLLTFLTSYGNAMDEYERQGVQEKHARDAALFVALTTTPLEFAGNLIQVGNIKKMIGVGKTGRAVSPKAIQVAEMVAQSAVAEGSEEFLQQYFEIAGNYYAANPDMSPEAITKYIFAHFGKHTVEALKAGAIGAASGALLAGLFGGARVALDEYKIYQKEGRLYSDFEERFELEPGALREEMRRVPGQTVRQALETLLFGPEAEEKILPKPKEAMPEEFGARPGEEAVFGEKEPEEEPEVIPARRFATIREAQKAGARATEAEAESWREAREQAIADADFFVKAGEHKRAMQATVEARRFGAAVEAYEEPEKYEAEFQIGAGKIQQALEAEYTAGVDITEEWEQLSPAQRQEFISAGLHVETDRSGKRVIGTKARQKAVDEFRAAVLAKRRPVVTKTYSEGIKTAKPKQDIIVQTGTKPGRVLFAQISTGATATTEEPQIATDYFDTLYTAREGYQRPEDFWEIPTWIPTVAASIKDGDMMAVRNPVTAAQHIKDSGYEAVMFSAMDMNKHVIKQIAELVGPGVRIIVGGYVPKAYFKDNPNVEFFDTLDSAVVSLGHAVVAGQDTRHFKGTKTIPRLCMSRGCLHKCAFCVVPKEVKAESDESIDIQIQDMQGLDFTLVYLDDKTFGQAKNYTRLPEILEKIRAINPKFKGFIIQTTAPQLLKLDDEFLNKAGIKFVELGVESYNDQILSKIHKPAREKTIDQCMEKLRRADIAFIPNILVGLAGKGWSETKETYKRTLDFLERNRDIISHVNVYNLAAYAGTELADELESREDIDIDENSTQRSWHKNPQLHESFYKAVLDFGKEQLQKKFFRVGLRKSEMFKEAPEKMGGLQVGVVAIMDNGKLYSAKLGTEVNGQKVFNHASLIEAVGADFDTVIPGFLNEEGKFIAQYPHREEPYEIGLAAEKKAQLGLFRERVSRARKVGQWVEKPDEKITEGKKPRKPEKITTEGTEALHKAGVHTGPGPFKPGSNFLVSMTEEGGLIYGPARKSDTARSRTKETLTGPVEITEYYRTIAGKEFKVLNTPILPKKKADRAKLIDQLASEFAHEMEWYVNWQTFMANLVAAGAGDEKVQKLQKIQTILSAGTSPAGAQAAFETVLQSLESKGHVTGGEGTGLTRSMAPKINAIWNGEDKHIVTLEDMQNAYGVKIGAMMYAGLHPAVREGAVVVDRHIARLWGCNVMWAGNFRVPEWLQRTITEDIVAASERLGKPVPAVQAALWYASGAGHWGSATHFEEAVRIAPRRGLSIGLMDLITIEKQAVVTFRKNLYVAIHGASIPQALTKKEKTRLRDLQEKERTFGLVPITQEERNELLELQHKKEGDHPNVWSKNDVAKRIKAHTPDNPYTPLGYWYGPGVRREVWYWDQEPHLTTVYEDEIYNLSEDRLGYTTVAWERAKNDPMVKAGKRTAEDVYINALIHIIQRAEGKAPGTRSFKGFSTKTGGRLTVFTFGEMPVEEFPVTVDVFLSDAVVNTVPQPATLQKAGQVGAPLVKDLEMFVTEKLKTYPLNIQSVKPLLANVTDVTTGDIEHGLMVTVKGPITAIRAAFSDIIGLQRAQNQVMLLHENKAPNGTLLSFMCASGDLRKIEAGLRKDQITDYVLLRDKNAWKLNFFIPVDHENSREIVDRYFRLFEHIGKSGTLQHARVHSEMLTREDVDGKNYESHIKKFFGNTKGQTVYENGRKTGADWIASSQLTFSTATSSVGLQGDAVRQKRGVGAQFRSPEAEEHAPGTLEDAIKQTSREGPPRAVFLGWQELASGPPIALYNVFGNTPYYGTTLTAEGLKKAGIEVPPAEVEFCLAGLHAEHAPTTQLREAIGLFAEGKSVRQIWQQTGWIRGAEGQWKFEIDDSQAKIVPVDMLLGVRPKVTPKPLPPELRKHFTEREIKSLENALQYDLSWVSPYTLSDILDHPALYFYYPELRDMPIEFDPGLEGGMYDTGTRSIVVGTRGGFLKNERAIGSMFHEVQHAIQQIEGFAGGSSIEREYFWLKRQPKYANWTEARLMEEANRRYFASGGEMEARDTRERRLYTSEMRKYTVPYSRMVTLVPMEHWIITFDQKTRSTSFTIQKDQTIPEAEYLPQTPQTLLNYANGVAQETAWTVHIIDALRLSGLAESPEVLDNILLDLKHRIDFTEIEALGPNSLLNHAQRRGQTLDQLRKDFESGQTAIKGGTAYSSKHPMEAVITLAIDLCGKNRRDLHETLYHEFWHYIERFLIPADVMKQLEKWMPNSELRADAFAEYVIGIDPKTAMPSTLRQWWDKLAWFFHVLYARFMHSDMTSIQEVFEYARHGLWKPYSEGGKIRLRDRYGNRLSKETVFDIDDMEFGDSSNFRSAQETADTLFDNEATGKQRVEDLKDEWMGYPDGAFTPPRTQAPTAPIENEPHIMELPEILELYKSIMSGKVPRVRENLLKQQGNIRGLFMPSSGVIKLDASIFRNPNIAAKVLAHEIGHWIDWLPQRTLMLGGNILGKIASLKGYLKQTLPFKLGAPGELTNEDRARLREEAIKILGVKKEERTRVIDESIVQEIKITPQDILNIWNSIVDARTLSPELYKYIAGLSDDAKKQIVKAALKGLVPAELEKFKRIVKTGKTREVKEVFFVPPSEKEIADKLKSLLEAEIKKRKLWIEEEIRNELMTLSARWRPWDPSQATEWFKHYRASANELYADAISVLLNDPAFLRAQAPKFYEAFFNWLEQKTEVKQVYMEIQRQIHSGEVDRRRTQRFYEMFDEGNKAYGKQFEDLSESVPDEIKRAFWDTFHFILKDVRRIGDGNIPVHENPRYALERMVYTGSEHEALLTDLYANVIKPLEKNGIKWDREFGLVVLLRRVIHDRDKMANPGGWDVVKAMNKIESLRNKELTKKQWDAIVTAVKNFRTIHEKYFIAKAEATQVYDDDMIKRFKDNTSYATWDVLPYLEERYGRAVAMRIYHQVGTLADIANPATATIMKDMAFIKAANRNHAVRTVVKFYLDYAKNLGIEITPADRKWNGRTRAIQEPKDPRKGLLVYLYKGKAYGYYVPKGIADAVNENHTKYTMTARFFRYFAAPFRKIFTELNYGFWIFNAFFRDAQRMVMALPGYRVDKFAKAWMKGLKPAFRSTFGIPDKTIIEMQKDNMLITVGDYHGLEREEEQIERLLRMYHMKPPHVYHSKIIKPFGTMFNWVANLARLTAWTFSATGRALERTTKVGTYMYLKEKFPDMPTDVLGHMVRSRGGSPDFLRAGREHQLYNNILIFSNAMKEGYRGDWEAFKENPGEFLIKKFTFMLAPKVLMWAGLAGLLGPAIKTIYDRATEYDLTNYIIIPLGMTDSGKAVYWRIPTDETSRFMGGVIWKLLRAPELGISNQFQDLFDYMAGQAPTVSPGFTAVLDTLDYVGGKNPYDRFYGRHAVDDVTFQAYDIRSHKKFIQYLASKMGASIVYKFKHDKVEKVAEELESILGFPVSSKVADFVIEAPDQPVISNILGRFLKVTDYGVREDILKEKAKVRRENARSILDAREAAYAIVDGKELTDRQLLALAQKPDVMQRQMMLALGRKYGMVYFEEWMSAASNNEKMAILRVMLEKNALAGQDVTEWVTEAPQAPAPESEPEYPPLELKDLIEGGK